MNRAVVLAYAYEITGDVSYQKYLLRSMDYLMGVNAMGISYVTVRTSFSSICSNSICFKTRNNSFYLVGRVMAKSQKLTLMIDLLGLSDGISSGPKVG